MFATGGLSIQCAWEFVQTNRYLDAILADIAPEKLDGTTLQGIVKYVHSRRGAETTSKLDSLNPLLKIFKASPAQVDRLGGHCGNLARLTLSLLRLRHVEAHKVHLYNEKGYKLSPPEPYVHAVVLVELEGRSIVADPLFGVVFQNDDGYASFADLKRDPDLVLRQMPATYPSDLFTYHEPRGIRWSILPLGEQIHNILAVAFGLERINRIRYPYILERPNLIQAVLFALMFLFFSGTR